MTEKSDDRENAAVFDFIDEYLGDIDQGRILPLAHYVARYASHQDRIAREYLAFKDPVRSGSNAADTSSDTVAARGAVQSFDDATRLGPYRLIRELGRGGQGTVFLADDVRIGRRVALKVLAARFEAQSQERLKRFRREAEIVARLEHPGICGIYDADLDGATPYIAMRHVDGTTLAQRIAEARDGAARSASQTAPGASPTARAPDERASHDLALPPRTSVDVRRVLHVFERIARALHAAHEAGVVHRDVKPGNLIVARDGTPVVLDFGLARDEHSELAHLTGSDEVFGTPAYMSPEQLRGSGETLDRRTDVYSLGTALYEALTLRRPFDAPQRAALYRAIESEPMPDPRSANAALSEEVKVVLETALEKDPARRYASALEFAEDLRRIREYEPIHARPASVPLRFARWTRRHPALAVSIIGTIVALSAGLGVSLWLLAREQRALRLALERQLAERSTLLIPEDPSAALALGIEAAELAQSSGAETNYLTRMALLAALDACSMQHELDNSPARLVTDIATSPDTRTLAAALDDGSAQLWDIDSGKSLVRLRAASSALAAISFSPDGARVACGSKSGSIAVWDIAQQRSQIEVQVDSPVVALEFSHEGAHLLAVAESGRATVWETRSWNVACVIDDGDGGVAIAHFAPDGMRIATSAAPRHARARIAALWDARDGRRLSELAGHEGAILALNFDPNPERNELATASEDHTVRVWDARSGAAIGGPLPFDAPVQFVVFSPDGSRLAAAERDDRGGWCTLVDRASGKRMKLLGHEGRRVVDAAFSPDSQRLATTSYDNTVRVWNAQSGEPELRFDGSYRSLGVRWALDGRRLVTRSNGFVAHVWYAVNRPDTFQLKGHTGAVRSVAFSPDGLFALSASEDRSACLWTAAGDEPGRLVCVFEHDAPVRRACFRPDGAGVLTVAGTNARIWDVRDASRACAVLEHPEEVVSAEFDSLGAQVLTVCADGRARIWRVDRALDRDAPPTRAPIVLGFDGATIACARFSFDSHLVAAGCSDDRVGVWNALDGTLVARIDFESEVGARRGVSDIAFSPRGDEIAAACADSTLRFWNPRTGKPARDDVVLFEPRTVEYSRDGADVLATGRSGGGAVRVQHLASANPTKPENVHTGNITTSALAPDGRSVLTGSKDCTVHLWDSTTGRPLVRRIGARSPILCAAFNTDGSNLRVISACEDGSVSIWPVDPLPAAKARKPRDLTARERARESRLAEPLSYE